MDYNQDFTTAKQAWFTNVQPIECGYVLVFRQILWEFCLVDPPHTPFYGHFSRWTWISLSQLPP